MLNLIRKTTLNVVRNSKDVRLDYQAIKKIAEKLRSQQIKIPSWPKDKHLVTDHQERMLNYLLILDTLNFCFWSRKARWKFFYKNKEYDGYFALSLALKKFFEENQKKTNLFYFSKISFKNFLSIFKGKGELLLMKKRWQMVRAVSDFFLRKYQAKVKNFILSASHRLSILIPKIFREIPYFNDFSVYQKKKVYFLKRAQIFAVDIYGAFKGKGIGYFKDLNYLTAFADYKIPQILHHFGILKYSPFLERKIKNKILLPAGSSEEIEIRSNTIWAIDCLKKELEKLGLKFYSFQIDWFLWNKSQKLKMKTPHHLTRTIFY